MLAFQQIPGVNDVLKAGEAIQSWPFWVVMVILFVFIVIIGYLVYRGTQRTQSDTTSIMSKMSQGGSDATAANAAVLAQMATLLTAYQKKDGERDKADAERDKAIALMAEGLKQQNELLRGIKDFQESGNQYTQVLHSAIVGSVSDTTTAVGAVGQSLTQQLEAMQKKLLEVLGDQPAIFAEKTINSHNAVRTSVQELSRDITRVFAPVIAENNRLNESVRFLNGEIATRDTQIAALLQRLEDKPPLTLPTIETPADKPKDGEM